MTTDSLTHPLPFFHHAATARVLYILGAAWLVAGGCGRGRRFRGLCGDIARDFLAFVGRAPTPDSFTRYIAEMAGKLTDVANPNGGDPTAKIDCAGSYENSSCWNVSCSCDTLNSCGTLSVWCGAVGGKESGLSCSASSKGGC